MRVYSRHTIIAKVISPSCGFEDGDGVLTSWGHRFVNGGEIERISLQINNSNHNWIRGKRRKLIEEYVNILVANQNTRFGPWSQGIWIWMLNVQSASHTHLPFNIHIHGIRKNLKLERLDNKLETVNFDSYWICLLFAWDASFPESLCRMNSIQCMEMQTNIIIFGKQQKQFECDQSQLSTHITRTIFSSLPNGSNGKCVSDKIMGSFTVRFGLTSNSLWSYFALPELATDYQKRRSINGNCLEFTVFREQWTWRRFVLKN